MIPKRRWQRVAAFLASLWLMMWTLQPILRSDHGFYAQAAQATFVFALWCFYVSRLVAVDTE